jgi:arylsulfatase A-like enzyme
MMLRKLISCFNLCSLLLGLSFLSAYLSRVSAQPEQDSAPNIIFIPADELTNWVGYLDEFPGYSEKVHTPNLNRLAARGVAFTKAYCNAPACSPSRASFLSGLQPSTSGAYYGEKFRKIMPEVITLPQYFRENGYTTVGAGKIFHSFNQEDPKSWDDYLDMDREPQLDPYPLPKVSDHGDHQWAPLTGLREEDLGDYKAVSYGIEFLQRKHDKPFFLGVGFIKPHHPWVVPQKYFDLYPLEEIELPQVQEDDLDDLPPYGRFYADIRKQLSHYAIVEANQWELAIQGFLASVSYMDAQLGRLLDALDASTHADNTIIVLFGDNGMHFGEKNHWTKWALWEQATNVPLVIVAPGVSKAGSLSSSPVGLVDVYPTLVELAGLPPNPANEGESLVPILKDPFKLRSEPVLMTFGEGSHALRDSRWRYIRYRDGSEELYDHRKDPHEWINLAGKSGFTEVINQLSKYLPLHDAPEDDFSSKIYWPNDPSFPLH